MNDLDQYYKVLELLPGASREEISQAYKDLAFIWHPYRIPKDNPRLLQKAEEKIKEINQAREQLRSIQPRGQNQNVQHKNTQHQNTQQQNTQQQNTQHKNTQHQNTQQQNTQQQNTQYQNTQYQNTQPQNTQYQNTQYQNTQYRNTQYPNTQHQNTQPPPANPQAPRYSSETSLGKYAGNYAGNPSGPYSDASRYQSPPPPPSQSYRQAAPQAPDLSGSNFKGASLTG